MQIFLEESFRITAMETDRHAEQRCSSSYIPLGMKEMEAFMSIHFLTADVRLLNYRGYWSSHHVLHQPEI